MQKKKPGVPFSITNAEMPLLLLDGFERIHQGVHPVINAVVSQNDRPGDRQIWHGKSTGNKGLGKTNFIASVLFNYFPIVFLFSDQALYQGKQPDYR